MTERAANVCCWLQNGSRVGLSARVATKIEVSIGRTNSKRGLGFVVRNGKTSMDFVLDKDQVQDLITYLEFSLHRLLKPSGKRKEDVLRKMIMPEIRSYLDRQKKRK
jgi:hypothetical protein